MKKDEKVMECINEYKDDLYNIRIMVGDSVNVEFMPGEYIKEINYRTPDHFIVRFNDKYGQNLNTVWQEDKVKLHFMTKQEYRKKKIERLNSIFK